MPTEPDPVALDSLVADCVAAVEESGPDAIEQFCRGHPLHAKALRRRLELLLDVGLIGTVPAADPLPERFGEFRIVERLGGGGMGEVFRAVQEGLGREVALKTIRPELLQFRDSRERFRREIETLAKLSHSGIVPIYGSGDANGVPWFAMEHVRGASLAQILAAVEPGRDPAQLHGSDLRGALERVLQAHDQADDAHSEDVDPAAPGTWPFRGTWLEACLVIGRDVAAALDHSHRAGILHRDVKPSNVLLGVDGRARLFDFGLARPESESADADERARGLTRTGAMVGSLPYMAPEQVRGLSIDRRTDVYGLAATLVEMLTLRPLHDTRAAAHPSSPAAGPATHEDQIARPLGSEQLREAILAGHRPRLRERNRAIPRDLVTVLEKALDPDPDRRYPTAAEFARDLDAVLELRPVSARPIGVLLRWNRRARRHPVTALSILLIAVVLVGGPIVLLIANARIRDALTVAETETAKAEARFDDAYDAIVGLVAVVGDEDLKDLPGAAPIRLDVLNRSASLFERLLSERPDDRRLQVEQARIDRQIASVLDELGRRDEAAAERDRAEATLRAALASDTEDDPPAGLIAFELADLLVDRTAGAAETEAQGTKTLQTLTEALALLERAAETEARILDPSRVLSARRQTLHNMANVHRTAGQSDRAMESVDAAIEIAMRLADEGPRRSSIAQLAEGSSRSLRATLLLEAGDDELARAEYERAERILRDLVGSDARPRHRARLALLLNNQSVAAYRSNEHELAQSKAEEAKEILEQLVIEQPYRTSFRQRLASAFENLGLALAGQGRPEDAVGWFERNADEHDVLVSLLPNDLRLEYYRAIAHHNCASVYLDLGRRADAVPHAELGFAEFSRLANERGLRPARAQTVFAAAVRARARLALGEWPDQEQIEATVESAGRDQARAWHTIAQCYADAAGLAKERGAEDFADTFATAALRALERAIDEGYDRVDTIDGEADFDCLRERPEFAALLARMRG